MKARLPKEYVEKYKTKKVPQMTLYDFNKQMVAQMPPMTEEDEQKHITALGIGLFLLASIGPFFVLRLFV